MKPEPDLSLPAWLAYLEGLPGGPGPDLQVAELIAKRLRRRRRARQWTKALGGSACIALALWLPLPSSAPTPALNAPVGIEAVQSADDVSRWTRNMEDDGNSQNSNPVWI